MHPLCNFYQYQETKSLLFSDPNDVEIKAELEIIQKIAQEHELLQEQAREEQEQREKQLAIEENTECDVQANTESN